MYVYTHVIVQIRALTQEEQIETNKTMQKCLLCASTLIKTKMAEKFRNVQNQYSKFYDYVKQ